MRNCLFVFCTIVFCMACTSPVDDARKLDKILKQNPDVLIAYIKRNRSQIAEILDIKVPQVSETRPLRPGSLKGKAPVDIVVYSNFSCSFCKKGADLIRELAEKYKGQARIVFKHLSTDPLSYKKVLIFEKAGLRSPEDAWAMHDFMFLNQEKLTENLDLVDEELKRRSFNVEQFYSSINHPVIMKHIAEDNAEIRKFGIIATPTFIINGEMVKGVVPLKELIEVVEKSIEP